MILRQRVIRLIIGVYFFFAFIGCTRGIEIMPHLSDNSNSWNKKEELVVSTTPLDLPLDTSSIRSISIYIVLAQLGRSIIKTSDENQIEADVASSWEIKDNKEFIFTLKKSLKFSDGTPITSNNIKCTIERQKRIGTSIHFDFSTISKVDTEGNKVKILLTEPNPRFIQQLVHPEFTILTEQNCLAGREQQDFSVSSGAYSLEKVNKDFLLLKKNPYFSDFSAPPKLKVISAKKDQIKTLLNSGKIDFALGSGHLATKEMRDLREKLGLRAVKSHIGFSYWLSVNPLNPDLKSKDIRLKLISALRQSYDFDKSLEPYWEPASQLYLPGGMGRTKVEKLDEYWLKLRGYKSPKFDKPLNVLLQSDFKLKKTLEKNLKDSGFKLNIEYYSNLKEFARKIEDNPKKYHLFLINNDFSSMSLFENLKVTFNHTRPLIILGDVSKDIKPLMKLAENFNSPTEEAKAYENIEGILMNNGLVYPVAYNNLLFFVKDSISLERWSKVYPEIAFWKIKPS